MMTEYGERPREAGTDYNGNGRQNAERCCFTGKTMTRCHTWSKPMKGAREMMRGQPG